MKKLIAILLLSFSTLSLFSQSINEKKLIKIWNVSMLKTSFNGEEVIDKNAKASFDFKSDKTFIIKSEGSKNETGNWHYQESMKILTLTYIVDGKKGETQRFFVRTLEEKKLVLEMEEDGLTTTVTLIN